MSMPTATPTSTPTKLYTVSGELAPRAPFDFAKTYRFLHGFSPTAGEQALHEGAITKAVAIGVQAIAFTVRSTGSVEQPRLAYTLAAERPLSADEQAAVADRIGFFLSLDDDLAPFYTLGRADPHFAPVIQRFYGLHHPKFLTPFEIACWAILGQRVPMRLARQVKVSSVDQELLKAAAQLYSNGQPLTSDAVRMLLNAYGTAQGYWAYYARIATIDTFGAM